MTIITLSNGKKVGNFSSPHPFEFEDGSILPAVSAEEAERLKVDFIEKPLDDTSGALAGDLELEFMLTNDILSEITKWRELKEKGEVDVVFCPLPMLMAMKEHYFGKWYTLGLPFRAIRIEDRIKKLVSIHKQCV